MPNPKKHILLTGPPGCGKTTLVGRLIDELAGKRLAGFYTEEIRQDGCRAMANARPAGSVVNSGDPAAYKPKTEFDNTPWRFNMTQNGKRMTADEFDAWMKSKGVRVAKGNAASAAPAASEPAPASPAPKK